MSANPRRRLDWHQSDRPLRDYEIERGRSVVNDWDKALREPWVMRKARLATERAAKARGVRQ